MFTQKITLIALLFLSTVANANLAQDVRRYLNIASEELRSQGMPADLFIIARVGLDASQATVLKGEIKPVVDSVKKRMIESPRFSRRDVLDLIPKDKINHHRRVSFTHGGFAYRVSENNFKVMHILTGRLGTIYIHDNSLEHFYKQNQIAPADGGPRALISALTPHVQKRTLELLEDERLSSMVSRNYNIISLKNDIRDQNSTQFLTELIALGLSNNPKKSRSLAFKELDKLNYRPTLLHINSSKLRTGKFLNPFDLRIDMNRQYGRGSYGNIYYVNTILALRLMLQRNKLSVKEYHIK